MKSNKINSIKNLFKILEIDRLIFTKLIIAYLIVALLDLTGLMLLLTFVQSMLNQSGNNLIALKFGHDNIFSNNLIIILSLITFLYFLKTIFILSLNKYLLKFIHMKIAQTRENLMKSILRQNYIDFIVHNITYYVDIFFRQLNLSITGTFLPFVKLVGEGIIFLFIFIYLLYLSPQILLLFMLIFVFFFLFYEYFFKKKIINFGKRNNIYNKELIQILKDSLTGFIELKIYNKESFILKKVINKSHQIADTMIYPEFIKGGIKYTIELFVVVLTIISVSIVHFSGKEIVDYIPLITVFIFAFLKYSSYLNSLIGFNSSLNNHLDTIEILNQNFKKLEFSNIKKLNFKRKSNITFSSITLKSVYFKYKDNKDYTLSDIKFKIEKNKIYSIVGESGVGKSTLINVLLGILKPTKGEIFINNEKINDLEKIQNLFAILPQKIFTMNSSILENITLEENPKMKNFYDSLRLSQIDESDPNLSIEKIIKDSNNISGGQAQRIGIARSLYHNKKILVLDEPTSAIDKLTESKLIDSLLKLKRKCTIIIISHSENLIKISDHKYVLKNKKLSKVF